MKFGDLVLYSNPQKMILPTLGIFLKEELTILGETRFFWVILSSGTKQLISEHHLVQT